MSSVSLYFAFHGKYFCKYKQTFLILPNFYLKKLLLPLKLMKKIMSCILLLCLVTLTTNVAYASINHKGKICVVDSGYVSKIEVVKSDVVTFEHMDYLATDSTSIRASYFKALEKSTSFVNVFIVPDRLVLNHNRVVHDTIYILNIPKNYNLPNKNIAWRFGSNIRC